MEFLTVANMEALFQTLLCTERYIELILPDNIYKCINIYVYN